MRIADFIGSDNPWSYGAMSVERLSHSKRRAMELPVARRHVIRYEISEYMCCCIGFRHSLGSPPDYNAELHFIVQLFGHARVDVVIRPGKARCLFVEPNLVIGSSYAKFVGLCKMLRVVHADGQIFARPF